MLISLELFVMLVLANGAPVVAAGLLKGIWSAPVDGGRLWKDGRPILGKSKTWRGVVSGALACGLFSLITGLGFIFGVVFGVFGLIGDMLSSFIKRRRDLAVVIGVVVLFTLSNIFASPLLYRIGIRRHPH